MDSMHLPYDFEVTPPATHFLLLHLSPPSPTKKYYTVTEEDFEVCLEFIPDLESWNE